MTLIRHALAITVLPATVTVVVPVWIARRYAVAFASPVTVGDIALAALGGALLLGGLGLFTSSLVRFATEGRGTLAPWDPPRQLVVHGPYRYVRNPMISGVIFVLLGEALVLRSVPHGVWAATFMAINVIYIPLLEEPMLAARFGAAYDEYRRHVPRFIPRIRPWRSDRPAAGP